MLESLAVKYGIDVPALHTINMQRLGLRTDLDPNVVRIDVNFEYEDQAFHIPFANNSKSPYRIQDGKIPLGDSGLEFTVQSVMEDVPTPYYFRGKEILVINSTFLSACVQKCSFCEQSTAPKRRRYSMKFSAEELFDKVMNEQDLPNLGSLAQISVITSCAGTEAKAQELVLGYKQEAEGRGFRGKILFATNEIRSEEALRVLAEAGNVILAFTVECFTNRRELMPGSKGSINLEKIKEILSIGKSLGMETTYFYILGLDDLRFMETGFALLKDAISIAPTGPTYQSPARADNIGTRSLEYFLQARKIFHRIHKDLQQFESCQSFRSLDPLEIRLSRTAVTAVAGES
jgi:hypothetical protein